MKVSIESANKLLKTLGLDVAVAESDDEGVDISAIVETYQTEQREELKPVLAKELTPEIERAALAKAKGSVASIAARTFGTGARKEYEAMETVDDIIKKVKENYDASVGKTTQEWQAERQSYEDTIEKLTNEKAAEVDKINSEWQNRYDDHFITSALIDVVGKSPKKAGDVSEIAEVVRFKLGKEYSLKYNHETKQLEAYKGDKIVKDFKPDEYVKSHLEKSGNLVTDTRHLKPNEVANNPQYVVGVREEKVINGSINFADVVQELG